MKKRRMARALRSVNRGNPVRRSGPANRTGRAEHRRQTIRRLEADLIAALKQIEELKVSAERDFLLDIFNRRGFAREFDRCIDYIKRYPTTLALVVLDVDRLKPINDAFGHSAGDQVLQAIARTLTAQVRSSDLVGRLGGDEFGILLWNLDKPAAEAKAAALERAVDELSFLFGGRTTYAGASVGVAILDGSTEAAHALEQADRAMYVRKAQRRGEFAAVSNGSSDRRAV
jgi:diguanylate cyclase (GGDEF)-like protein